MMLINRFEFKEGKSDKFWEFWTVGSILIVHFGRVGTRGQFNIKKFDSPELSLEEGGKLARAKAKKGYKEVKAEEVSSSVHDVIFLGEHSGGAVDMALKCFRETGSLSTLQESVEVANEGMYGFEEESRRSQKGEEFLENWDRSLGGDVDEFLGFSAGENLFCFTDNEFYYLASSCGYPSVRDIITAVFEHEDWLDDTDDAKDENEDQKSESTTSNPPGEEDILPKIEVYLKNVEFPLEFTNPGLPVQEVGLAVSPFIYAILPDGSRLSVDPEGKIQFEARR